MKLNELATEIHELAVEKGWYENERSALEIHMLIVSEVAEATESVRKGEPHRFYVPGSQPNTFKPEGEAVELVDALIRICDYFGAKGWDLEAIVREKINYNKTRSHRHGGKKL